MRRLISLSVSFALTFQSLLAIPAYAHDNSATTQAGSVRAGAVASQHAQAWVQAVDPSSIWDTPTVDRSPGEMERLWLEALQKTNGNPLGRQVSDADKAAYFNMWIERLRHNAFSQGSADPNSRYYTNHPLDVFQLLGQRVHVKNEQAVLDGIASGKPLVKVVDWEKLTLTVVDEKGQPVMRMNPEGRDLRHLIPENRHIQQGRWFGTDVTPGATEGGLYTFELSAQGKKLHSFQNNVNSVAVIGQYLVFLEPSRAMGEHGVLNLSFIDLEYFESAIGKTVLPIFRVPLEIGDLARQPEKLNLRATEQGIEIGDRKISPQVFEFWSHQQQMPFNLMVSLTDPQTYKTSAPLVVELLESWNAAMEDQAKSMDAQFESAGITFDTMRKFQATQLEELKLRAQVGAPAAGGPRENLIKAKEELELEALASLDKIILENNGEVGVIELSDYPTPLAQDARTATAMRLQAAKSLNGQISDDLKAHTSKVKQFGKELIADANFQNAMQSFNQTIAKQRKLSNRISALWTRMTVPQPLGAPKIQQALGMIAASVYHRDSQANEGLEPAAMAKEGIARLLATGKGKVGLAVLVGGGLAAIYPAEAGQFSYQAIEGIRTSMDAVMGWGSNWAYLASETWTKSWAFVSGQALVSAYWVGDNFSHLMTGLSALMGGLLLAAGGMHVIVNTTAFVKSMVKGGWKAHRQEGLNWLKQLKHSFIQYMNEDKKAFYDSLARAEAKKRGLELEISGRAGGPGFKGIFQDAALNDHSILSKAELEHSQLEIELRTADGRNKVKGILHSRGDRHHPNYTDADIKARAWNQFDLTLADGHKLSRALQVTEGDTDRLFTDENLEAGLLATVKSERGEMAARLQNTNWTASEKAELDQIMHALEEGDRQTAATMEKLAQVPLIGRFFQKSDGQIRTLGKALAHFFIGYSSWTHSTRLFGKIWNPWFLIRNIAFRPRAWMTMLAYPNYFNRAVFGAKEGHFASYYNGGTRSILELNLWKKIGGFVIGDKDVKHFLDELNEFEKEVIPVEQTMHAAAMRAAFLKFVEQGADDPDVARALRKGAIVDPMDSRLNNSGFIRNGMRSIGQAVFGTGSSSDKLDKKLSVYLKAYFTRLYDDSMDAYFRKALGPAAEGLSTRELKILAIEKEIDLKISDEDAMNIVREVEAKGEAAAYASQTANDFFGGLWERIKQTHMFKVRKALDPSHNYSLNRYKTAEIQMNNPEAMARATRQYLVSLVVDKPMELLFLLVFLAGVDQGIMKPLHDSMFSENSLFHMGRMPFWNGYFTGIMIALLADVWMKIQMDARLDQQGGFDDVADLTDAKKGYLAYYRKGFLAKDNTWWSNQKFEVKLSLANMPAYFLTALITNLTFLGRFDLDAFATVYKSILFPTGGLAFKLENAFEKSTGYVLGRVPVKYHVDPRVREYRNKAIGKLRFKYNIVYKAYENVVSSLLGNFFAITTDKLGPRSFLRQIYGGYIPTELVVNNVLRPVGRLGGVFETVASGCEVFLTNKHTDAIKIKPKNP